MANIGTQRGPSTALDKLLRDTELAVLSGTGSMSHEEALDWAERTIHDVR